VPQFEYVAYSRDGTEHRGEERAASEQDLESRLKRRRLVLVKAHAAARPRAPAKLSAALVGELASLLDGGMVLARALQVLATEAGIDPELARLAETLRQGLQRGRSLSEALADTMRFDPLLIPLVRVGEATGRLAQTLAILEAHYQERRKLNAEILTALAYPSILVTVSVLSLFGLGIYVVPVFRNLFRDEEELLPFTTQVVFAVSDWLIAYGPVMLGTIFGLVVAGFLAMRFIPALRRPVSAGILRIPLFGPLLSLREGGRLMVMLGILLERNVQLVEALDLARESVTNYAQRLGLTEAVRELRQGRSLSAAMVSVPGLPDRARQMIIVGDESGQLGTACAKAGARLEQTLRERLRSLIALAEPLVVLVMGGAVGFVVVSMLLAVFSFSDLAAT
jgi:general secretion pathway protein F